MRTRRSSASLLKFARCVIDMPETKDAYDIQCVCGARIESESSYATCPNCNAEVHGRIRCARGSGGVKPRRIKGKCEQCGAMIADERAATSCSHCGNPYVLLNRAVRLRQLVAPIMEDPRPYCHSCHEAIETDMPVIRHSCGAYVIAHWGEDLRCRGCGARFPGEKGDLFPLIGESSSGWTHAMPFIARDGHVVPEMLQCPDCNKRVADFIHQWEERIRNHALDETTGQAITQ